MIRAWWPAFAGKGFIEPDFATALGELLLLDPSSAPRWDREHWALVMRYLVPAFEHRTRARKEPEYESGPECPVCHQGIVTVPLEADLRDGTWRPPYREGTVTCGSCYAGRERNAAARKMAEEGAISRPQMALPEYEARVCKHWRELMAERARAERLMLAAARETECLDTPSKLVNRLADGWTPPRRSR